MGTENALHGGKSCEDADLEILELRETVARLSRSVASMAQSLAAASDDRDRALEAAQLVRESEQRAKTERVKTWKEKKLRASGACTRPEKFIAAPSFDKAAAEERVREAHRAHLRRVSDRPVAR